MRKPSFSDYADLYLYAAALLRFEKLAYVEAIAEAARTAHVFMPYERRLNVEAAERGEVVPFLWICRCHCKHHVPYPPDMPGPWWTPGEEASITPEDLSRIVNGPKALREALERAPRGSRARAAALAAWRAETEREARRQIEAEDTQRGG